jgi:hypothetical protein
MATAIAAGEAVAAPINSIFTGGAGDWSDAGNWSPSVVPNNAGDTYSVFIDGGHAGDASVVKLEISATVDKVGVDVGDRLSLLGGTTLNLVLGDSENNGTVDFVAGGAATIAIGTGAATSLINTGVVQAGAASTLAVQSSSASAVAIVVNQELLQATAGGTLKLGSLRIFNGAGTIEAQDGSEVQLTNNGSAATSILGGTLTTTGTGVIRDLGSSTLNGVENNGRFVVGNGVTTELQSTVTNSAIMEVEAGGSATIEIDGELSNTGTVRANAGTLAVQHDQIVNQGLLQATGGGTLQLRGVTVFNGSGTIEAQNGSEVQLTNNGPAATEILGGTLTTTGTGVIRALGSSALDSVENNGRFVVGDAVTTSLFGTVTNNAIMEAQTGGSAAIEIDEELANTGTVRANGGILAVQATSSSAQIVNQGLMQATGGGTLQLGSLRIFGTDPIEAQDGSEVQLTNIGAGPTRLSGATLNTAGTGIIRDLGSSILVGVTNNGSFVVGNGVTTTIESATTTNNGTMEVEAGGSGTLVIETSESLDNSGTVRAAGGVLEVKSDSTGATARVDNAGVLQATGGGTLKLGSLRIFDTGAAVIEAQDGSEVQLTNNGSAPTRLAGQTLNTSGSGVIRDFGSSTLVGVTNNGSFVIGNGVTTTFLSANANNGAVAVEAGNTGTILIDDNATLNNLGTVRVGAGATLNMTGDGNFNQLGGAIVVDGTFNKASGLTMLGGVLTGSGVVNADVLNASVVAPGSSPGTLTINGNYVQASSGDLDIELGGLVAGTEYDQLLVLEDAFLNGALIVELINGFDPLADAFFDVLIADAVHGEFDVEILPSSSNGTWDVSYLSDRVRLVFDFDENGNPVPAPATILIFLVGLGFLAAKRPN